MNDSFHLSHAGADQLRQAEIKRIIREKEELINLALHAVTRCTTYSLGEICTRPGHR